MEISHERVLQLFSYDELSGILYSRGTLRPVGSDQNGYLSANVDGKKFYVHRLVWLWKTGSLPEKYIDHIDLDRTNNRFCNLREASHSENLRNSRSYTNNKIGLKGVSKKGRKFRAQISINGRTKTIGTFSTKDAAHAAYIDAARAEAPNFARAS